MRTSTGRTAIGSLFAAGLLCLGATVAHAASLVVSNVTGDPGSTVTFTVTLNSGGAQVAGTQSDIAFDPANIPVAAKANGKPNCTVNADISKGATSFAFRPNACTGTACTAVRALVLATDNTDPIPDGSVLFTCTVAIASTATGTYPLTQTGIILSDPNGNKVTPADSVDGSVATGGTTNPTPTPTTAVSQCPAPRPSPAGPGLWIPDQSIAAGTTSGTISVQLAAGGAQIAGTQSDITFPTNAVIAAKATGKPNCTVNPDINKGATSFAFRPNGCSGAACTAVRALVLATDNTDPIPDGSVLFTCVIAVDASASGTLDYTFSGVILSDPNGNKVTDAGNQDGELCISGGGNPPTPTPTTAVVACPSARPAPTGPGLWIPDQTVTTVPATGSFSVKLAAGGAQIAGTQSDITFPTNAPIAHKATGKPDCAVNPDINKGATSFAFRPNGCTAGTDCTAVRALVLATDNTDPIPDGSVLFTCNIAIDGTATGTLDYAFSGVILSDPNGNKVTDAGNQDGELCIQGTPPAPTATPTVAATAIPTATNTVPAPPTATASPTNTAKPATATPTHGGGGNTPTPSTTVEDEGGCQIGTSSHGTSGWLLVVPLVGLLVLRRRRS